MMIVVSKHNVRPHNGVYDHVFVALHLVKWHPQCNRITTSNEMGRMMIQRMIAKKDKDTIDREMVIEQNFSLQIKFL